MDNNVTQYTDTDLPYINGSPKVYVCQGGSFGLITRMLAEIGFTKAFNLEEADLIVYGGGSDVSPDFYGQKPIARCGLPDRNRDMLERDIFNRAKARGIPQMGICRGAQFLHVMCGGKLWQHVNNHTRDHNMFDLTGNVMVRTSSTHHQMMQWNDKMTLVACCDDDIATHYEDADQLIDLTNKEGDYEPQVEVEVCTYDDEKVLCIQGHPEYGPKEFTSWSLNFLAGWFAVNKKDS